MWPRYGDLIVIYAGLTPLCVMYWKSTFRLLDYYMNENHLNMLILGYVIVMVSIMLHETLRCVEDIFEFKCVYHLIYDYVVFTACIMYYRGCTIFFDLLKQSIPPIGIAVMMAALLILIRGFRNILMLPAVVNNDHIVDRYRPQNTLRLFSEEGIL